MKNSSNIKQKNKHIVFDDDGSAVSQEKQKIFPNQNQNSSKKENGHKFKNKRSKVQLQSREVGSLNADTSKKWFEEFTTFNTINEIIELKDVELTSLRKICQTSFESEKPNQLKKNPPDAKWLETALHKGTAKDRANAGALLVHTNPLANLQALDTLIGLCKVSNKSSPEVIQVLSELFIEALLPSYRKLLSITLRGADWKKLQKDENITTGIKNKILAYWYFENELKDRYFTFLQNLQSSLQTGQDVHKSKSIVYAAKLLVYSPEKEQMLLSMLINKLGDPSSKIASKALHHLCEVAFKHPNMCGVITNEAEKLLFRNNISEKAQHFTLCFLSQIAPRGHSDVCTKLVNICFAFFKVLVKKGTVNNKTMQAILRCLRKAIIDAKPIAGTTEIMSKEMQDTIYRLVHLAEIHISIQTLCLLLQLISLKSEKPDRFYNALYRKMLDLNLTTIGSKSAAQFLHIVHQAIQFDQNITRAKAFIKRLLQLCLYMPSHITCGCLIVVNKLVRNRKELGEFNMTAGVLNTNDINLEKFDSDDEERYKDVDSDDEIEKSNGKENVENDKTESIASWHHAKMAIKKEETLMDETKEHVTEISASEYNPYHRIPAYAGAEFVSDVELLLLKEHLHPTIKVFAETIMNRKNIDYYGDPLRDFSLTKFLERFCFKNPKKLKEKSADEPSSIMKMIHTKTYTSHGARGRPVTSLTAANCTEDEVYIFNYLQKKRDKQVVTKKDEKEDAESVDDDEFEEYLDSLCPNVATDDKEEDEDEDDFEVNYIKELGSDLKVDERKVKKKKKTEEDDDSIYEDDWMNDNEEEEGIQSDSDEEDIFESDDDDDEGVTSDDETKFMQDGEDFSQDEEMYDNNDDGEVDEPKSKKVKKSGSSKQFNKALKNNDMKSLFAAADDFAELLEDTGKTKGHGTSNALFNKDKSSEKQLKWEEKRRSDSYNNKSFRKRGKGGFRRKK